MTLESHPDHEVVMARAVMPAGMPEPPAVTPAMRAAFVGIRAPVRSCEGTLRGLADADGCVFALLLPTGSATLDLERAALLAAAINAGLGIAGRPTPLTAE